MKRIPRESSLVDRFPALRTLEREPPQREIPFVQQLSVNECGAACLAMSLASFGKDVPLDEISELLGAGRDGSSALDLLRAARWYDLRGRGVKIELDTLAYLKRGAILHWGFSHFVVFDRLRCNSVEIVDPASGRRLVSMEEFSRSFTGVALTLEFVRVASTK
jgi:ATP-binding cassette, subfamily B, bacterial